MRYETEMINLIPEDKIGAYPVVDGVIKVERNLRSLKSFFFNFLLDLHFQSFSNELRMIFVDIVGFNLPSLRLVYFTVPVARRNEFVFIRFFCFQLNFVGSNFLEVLGRNVDDCIENFRRVWSG